MYSHGSDSANTSQGPGSGHPPPPSELPTRVPRVAPVYLRSLLLEAARVGVDGSAFFRGLPFTAADLDVPGFMVSHQEAITVVRRALQALNNPHLGLELGARSRITHRGALALGLLASPSVKASIELSMRFPESAGFLLHVRAAQAPGLFTLLAEPMVGSHDVGDFLVDKLFAGLVRQWRQICDAECSPLLVELMRPPPANVMLHEQHFRAPVRFNCKVNRLSLDTKWLGWKLPMADAMACRLAEDLLEREAVRLSTGLAFSLIVGRSIRSMQPLVPTLAQVASQLHLSERSVRRKLAEEGVSFRKLLDDSRRARAIDLLSNGRRSLAEAATETGFGDARSFRRAFRRWTGVAPSELRHGSPSPAAETPPEAGER